MEILINTADIQNASNHLKSKVVELESAIQSAESAINPLRGFSSPRIGRDLNAWDEIKSTCLRNLHNLLEAADELTRAAEANEAANN